MTRDRGNGSTWSLLILGILGSATATLASYLWTVGDLPAPLITWRSWLSTYRMYHGVPIEFGLVAGFALAGALIRERNNSVQPRTGLLVISTLIFGVSLGLAISNPRAIPLWLPTIVALALMVKSQGASRSEGPLAASAIPSELSALVRHPSTKSTFAIWLLAFVVVAQAFSSATSAVSRSEAQGRELIRWFKAAKPIQEPALLPQGNSHRLVLFSDYQCPSCRVMVPQIRSVISAARLAGTNITLEERDFPLAAKCNETTASTLHFMACEMAVAARVVKEAKPDKADEFTAWLYQQPDSVTSEIINAKLLSLGVAEQYAKRQADLLAEVMNETRLGARVGVFSTPTSFLDGVRLPALTPNGIASLVSELGARQRSVEKE